MKYKDENKQLRDSREASKEWRLLTDKGCVKLCMLMRKGAARRFRQKWLNEQHRMAVFGVEA